MDLNKELILSSHSPRRKALLEKLRIPFTVNAIEIDETIPDEVHYASGAEYLAVKKAKAHGILDNETIILAADTIVVYNDVIYGKPTSREDAINTLTSLSDKKHSVYTGVCIYSAEKQISFTEQSEVKFAPISDEEAGYYFDLDNPIDKAGSYGIQDWIGFVKVEYIVGSFTNILGLPLAQTQQALLSFLQDDK
ncbi:MAG: septum formation protein Maf [Saprospiraceae bacterium]|nr:septum formation protein Maf [Saprospiraceae bacterium]